MVEGFFIVLVLISLYVAGTKQEASVSQANNNTTQNQTTSLPAFVQLPSDVSALIEKYSAQYDVDANLIKVQAWFESRGKQSAMSPAGAIGVMQLEPATAKGLGVDPYDLAGNIEGGVKYMAQLIGEFHDYALALAAYNAGPGNVTKYNGIPPFAETQTYVSNILAALGLV